MTLGYFFILFVCKSVAQIPMDVQPSFDCSPTDLDNEPCMQSVCDAIFRPRTTTNPERPVNVTNRERINYFDWRTETFPVLLATGSRIQNPLVSPFYQTDNGNISRFTSIDGQDMRLEDGWEVLKYDLGGAFSAEGISRHTVSVPYVVLYNRFLGKLRVFIARGDEGYATNYCDITVKFDGLNSSSLLDLHHGSLIPLDAPFSKGELRSTASVLNIPGKWSFADFPLIYDPCTCEFSKNSIKISVKNVDESTLSLTGSLEGSLISRGTSNGDSNGFSWGDLNLTKGGALYVKSVGSINKFIDDSKKIIDNTTGLTEEGKDDKKTALAQLRQVFNSPVLRHGLQAVPYVTTALSLYDMFTAGGVSGPQKVSIMPMSLNASIRLSGTIIRTTNYTDITLSTPGSVPSSLLKNQPYYNEVLGVFNLLETPQINRKLDRVNYYDREQNWWNAETHTYSYSLAKPIKYVINPASGLEVQDIQAAFMLRDKSKVEYSTFTNQISSTMSTTQHIDLFSGSPSGTLETALNWPTTCDYGNIGLQLILNLRRKDGKGENVLLVVTYPTTFVNSGTCKQCVETVSPSDIRKFCQSSTYKSNRILSKEVSTETNPNTPIQDFKAYPNPADNQLQVQFSVETNQTVKIWLTDLLGRSVSDILEQKVDKGHHEWSIPTAQIPEGFHLFIFESNGIKKVQKVVIRH